MKKGSTGYRALEALRLCFVLMRETGTSMVVAIDRTEQEMLQWRLGVVSAAEIRGVEESVNRAPRATGPYHRRSHLDDAPPGEFS